MKFKQGKNKEDLQAPQELFNRLNAIHNFTLDVCASPDTKKCTKYFSRLEDGLKQKWEGSCWMYPPMGHTGQWVKKAYDSAQQGAKVVCLVTARTDTMWWHEYAVHADVEFIKGRLVTKKNQKGNGVPIAILTFTKKEPKKAFPSFTREQENWICEQIGEWYFQWKHTMVQHKVECAGCECQTYRLGFAKEMLKERLCSHG